MLHRLHKKIKKMKTLRDREIEKMQREANKLILQEFVACMIAYILAFIVACFL